MKQQKKNKFFTFIFSFVPGAVEMYMGFMKQGISLMTLFLICLALPLSTRIFEILALSAVLVWFYSFFHARNLATLSEEAFNELEDHFVWEGVLKENNFKISISSPTLRKWTGIILLVIGGTILWDNFSAIIYNLIPDRYWDELYPIIDRFPQVVIAVLIIAVGFKLIAGKKEELNGDER